MTVGSWPKRFDAKQVAVTSGTQYVRLGGKGPAVLLLHGFGDTGDMWVRGPNLETPAKVACCPTPDIAVNTDWDQYVWTRWSAPQ